MTVDELQNLLPQVLAIAQKAGNAILKIYEQHQPLSIKIKADKTPVTEADLIAHEIIKKDLQLLTPEIPVLSEEAHQISYDIRSSWPYYWLVDPLDGTKEFIYRTDEFTVNIALIANYQSILGVIYCPVSEHYYFAAKQIGAFKQIKNEEPNKIHTRCFNHYPVLAVSRRHGAKALQEFLQQFPKHELLIRGSSLKSCIVAEGLADAYPCMGPTSEWDMAAAQCIVEEAGGAILNLQGQAMRYNTKPSLLNPYLLIIADPLHTWYQSVLSAT